MNQAAGNFDTTLVTDQMARWQWQLREPLVYVDPEAGRLEVPAYFVTNFASIRSLRVPAVLIYAALVGHGNAACTVHDYLYGKGMLDRRACDEVLFRALRAEGVARWRAWMFYAGVRLGGRRYYRGSNALAS